MTVPQPEQQPGEGVEALAEAIALDMATVRVRPENIPTPEWWGWYLTSKGGVRHTMDWLAAHDAEVAAAAGAEAGERIAQAERALDAEIANRDDAEEWADRLAYAIAPQAVIGEHSSGNNPWQNALDVLDGISAAAVLRKAADDVQAECRASSVPCFCGSADWLRADAARVEAAAATEQGGADHE